MLNVRHTTKNECAMYLPTYKVPRVHTSPRVSYERTKSSNPGTRVGIPRYTCTRVGILAGYSRRVLYEFE
eukprot:1171498-Rhodomonas_salina.1